MNEAGGPPKGKENNTVGSCVTRGRTKQERTNKMKASKKKGFTLIELLVVVAIIAVIGAGVAVMYGREVVDDAKKQMTLHEMGQIRDAFQRFWADNAAQMMDGLTVPGSATPMPTADFAFIAGDTQTFNASMPADDPQRLYGALEFFERYGLWMLFQKSVGDLSAGTRENQIFLSANKRPS